ncbi:unnamed protein product [Medioppia subpectinata]|uniref:Metalloendopeptidase n=1 Tax=Medioppia subpectinata TaxID=1979941 RepID=A0A7R9KQ35_9ACAR|nr:unnamed protein product [Medioppia subpectinata]CAG2106469.1 unnamed protein product [Medioppia subpectinata]
MFVYYLTEVIIQMKQNKRNTHKKVSSSGSYGRTVLWPNASQRRVINQAMKNIQAQSCVRFKQRTNQHDYLQLFKGQGCYSSIGKTGGRQYLSLGYGCHYVGVATHEILHTLGFYHEQSRADRDNYLTIHWQNIARGMSSQYDKVSKSANHLYVGFDYQSIMIYGAKDFSKNGKYTMTAKQRGVRLSAQNNRRSMSSLDARALNTMYGCSGGGGGSGAKKRKRG